MILNVLIILGELTALCFAISNLGKQINFQLFKSYFFNPTVVFKNLSSVSFMCLTKIIFKHMLSKFIQSVILNNIYELKMFEVISQDLTFPLNCLFIFISYLTL